MESGGKVSGQFLSFAEEHYRQETQLVKRMMDLLSAKMDLNVTEADLLPLVLYFKSLNVKSQDGRTKAIILAHDMPRQAVLPMWPTGFWKKQYLRRWICP